MTCDTLLVLDTVEDRLSAQSLELIPFAAAIGRGGNSRTLLFLPGREVAAAGAAVAGKTGLGVIICEHEELYYPNPELLGRLLLATVAEFGPKLVCFLHTMRNCQTASALAVPLGAACITGVEACAMDDSGPTFRRSVVNGKLVQAIRPTAPRTVVTVLPGAFSAPDAPQGIASNPAPVLRRSYPFTTDSYRPTGLRRESESDARLKEAAVVVAAGRGIGKREHLPLLEDVARLFPNAAIGASRPLCDLKWLPSSRQVGVSGKAIAPRLYLACGISGAQQHLAGIRGAHCIVAINSDPQAAIFSVADYVVVEDLHAFLPLLIKKHQERFNH